MENNFSNLGISPSIIKAIEDMGFEKPTKVQSEAIPHILKLEDLIVMSKTGSGKTGAFGIPMLQSIDPNGDGPQALILTPTRELAVQVDSDLKKMSKYLEVTTTAVYGQHNINSEIQALKKGASVVTGTPGRVFDHISKKTLVTKNIKFVVLDEADRMLDMGFIDQVVRIIKALPRNRVTLLFSATMPAEIQKICRAYMKQPVTIELESDTKTVDSIKQVYYRVEPNEKRTQLNRLLKTEQPDSCMIFCNTRHAVDRVHDFLSHKGYVSASLHGANTQSSRMRTIEKFKKGKLQILVATDVAARGIHIDDLALVINYDVPVEKDSYVHRIGRTGRAGNGGKAITLVTSDDIMSLYEIEEHVGALIEEEELPTDAFVQECVSKYSGKWANVKPQRHHEKASGHSKKTKGPHSSTRQGGKPRHQQSGKPRNKQTEKPRPQQSEKPRTQQSAKPRTQQSAKPQTQQSAQSRPQQSTKPRPQHSGKPRPQHPSKPKSHQSVAQTVQKQTSKPVKTTYYVREMEPVKKETTTKPTAAPAKKKSFLGRLGEFIKRKK